MPDFDSPQRSLKVFGKMWQSLKGHWKDVLFITSKLIILSVGPGSNSLRLLLLTTVIFPFSFPCIFFLICHSFERAPSLILHSTCLTAGKQCNLWLMPQSYVTSDSKKRTLEIRDYAHWHIRIACFLCVEVWKISNLRIFTSKVEVNQPIFLFCPHYDH